MRIPRLIPALAAAGLLLLPASAQTAKLGTVDLRKVFDNYWKTKQADATLKDEAGGLDRERKTMFDQYQKAQDDYKKRLDSASDPAVSADEREKRKKAAEDELLKLKESQNSIEQFDRQARTTLGEKQRRMRDNLLAEIKEVVKVKAKAGGFTYIFDSASESVNNTPVMLYTSGENDITDDVLKQLNTNAPAETSKPAATESKPPKDDKK
jgi:outer membrane protein